MNMTVTVGVGLWAVSSLPASMPAVTNVGVAMTFKVEVHECRGFSEGH